MDHCFGTFEGGRGECVYSTVCTPGPVVSNDNALIYARCAYEMLARATRSGLLLTHLVTPLAAARACDVTWLAEGAGSVYALCQGVGGECGIVIVNVEPSPSVDETSRSPPNSVVMWRVIASPSPVPLVSIVCA